MGFYEELQKMPVFRLLMPFVIGIILQYNIRTPFPALAVLGSIIFLLLCFLRIYDHVFISFNYRSLYGLALNCFILIYSMCITDRKINAPTFMDHAGRNGLMVARAVEPPVEKERRYRVLLEPLWFLDGDSVMKTSGRALGWFEKDSSAGSITTGDILVIPNRFSMISKYGNPFEFDYRRYMNVNGVYGETYLSPGQWYLTGKSSNTNLLVFAGRLREHLLKALEQNGVSGKEYAVAAALILGYRSELDRETRDTFASTGAMHILAVSGLHAGILYILLHWMLGQLFRVRRDSPVRAVIIISTIWFYALLTGLSPSVTRSATMFSFVAVAGTLRRQTSIFNTLASSAFVHLFLNPWSLFMVGFQLSYIAVAGIVYFQPVISSLLKFRNNLVRKIWILSTVSVSAQLLVFPLGIYYFNQFPNLFLLTNIIAVPLAMVIMYLGLALFLFSFIPVLPFVIGFLLNNALMLLNFFTDAISKIPFSHSTGLNISLPFLLILYGIILLFSHFLIYGKPRLLLLSLLLAISAFTIRADCMIKGASRQIFVIYNTGGYSLYSFITPGENVIVSGSGTEIAPGDLPYAASGTVKQFNTGNVYVIEVSELFGVMDVEVPHPLYVKGRFVDFHGIRIYFPCSLERFPHNIAYPVKTDLLVISSKSPSNFNDIINYVIPDTVVIDSSVGYYQRKNIIEQCTERGIEYHDVRSSGAFTLHAGK